MDEDVTLDGEDIELEGEVDLQEKDENVLLVLEEMQDSLDESELVKLDEILVVLEDIVHDVLLDMEDIDVIEVEVQEEQLEKHALCELLVLQETLVPEDFELEVDSELLKLQQSVLEELQLLLDKELYEDDVLLDKLDKLDTEVDQLLELLVICEEKELFELEDILENKYEEVEVLLVEILEQDRIEVDVELDAVEVEEILLDSLLDMLEIRQEVELEEELDLLLWWLDEDDELLLLTLDMQVK